MTEQALQAYPLSPYQSRLWHLRENGANLDGSVVLCLCVPRAYDAARLKQALEVVTAHQEILRTVFQKHAGMALPMQVILERSAFTLSERPLPQDADSLAWSRQIAAETGAEPWDPAQGPLLRVTAIPVDAARHILQLSASTLNADAVTLRFLATHLMQLHENPEMNLDTDPEAMFYVDVADWLQELLHSEETEAGRSRWQAMDLATLNQPRLALDKGPHDGPHRTHEISLTLDGPFPADRAAFFQACFHVLLRRHCDQIIALGIALDGRKFEDLYKVYGPLQKFVPVVVDPNLTDTIEACTLGVANAMAEANQWQEFFAWDGVDAEPPAYAFHWCDRDQHAVPGASILFEDDQLERFALRLLGVSAGDRVTLCFRYEPERFSEAAVRLLADQLCTLIADARSRPQQPVGRLNLMSDAESNLVLHRFNHTQSTTPFAPVHRIIAGIAAERPNAPALTMLDATGKPTDETLSFAQMWEQVKILADLLRHKGISQETRVAVCMNRSPRLVTVLLAILEAGGTFVPVDPSYTGSRTETILRDSGAVLLLTEAMTSHQTGRATNAHEDACDNMLPFSAPCPVMNVDDALTEALPDTRAVEVHPLQTAYMIYTSGSTGKPKGVLVPHAGFSNYARWACTAYRVSDHGGAVFHGSIGFDATITSVFVPLMCGQPVHCLGEHQDLQALDTALRHVPKQGLAKLTPSHLDALESMDALNQTPLQVQSFILGGEALTGQHLAYWRQQLPHARFINEYGPTETVVGSCVFEVRGDHPDAVPIGSPIGNTRIYLTDAQGEPVPVGLVGELLIGGAGVSRGYDDKPGQTAARFLPDRFSKEPGARLYRTGDRARFELDEEGRLLLVYLGRADDQVKIRGFRIEPGEIEAHLAAHDALLSTAVIAREDNAGNRYLMAYGVLAQGRDIDTSIMQAYLADHLPDYMIPSHFQALDQLPLTTNGKLDRRKLTSPEYAPKSTRPYTAPRNPVEQHLCEVWGKVLDRDRIGVHDSFFEIGGNSLNATQVVSRIRTHYQIELHVSNLFEVRTIAKLAERVDTVRGEMQARPAAPTIQPREHQGPAPLSFPQRRLWFIARMTEANAAYNMLAPMVFEGTLDTRAMERAFDRIVARHEILRTVYVEVDGEPQQVILPESRMKLTVCDLSALSEERTQVAQQALLAQEAAHCFDLERGPILRAALVRLNVNRAVLMLSTHHIAFDGWSVQLLKKEFETLYDSFCRETEANLPTLPIQYADFAVWQRGREDIINRQIETWKQRLDGAPTLLDLPLDRKRPARQSFRGDTIKHSLGVPLTQHLADFNQERGLTLFMTGLAAFGVLLSHWSGRDDLLVGAPIANRHHQEVEGLIGCFVNNLVLRLRIDPEITFAGLLAQVKAETLEAYKHQDVPFERLVEACVSGRSLSHSPLCQVFFGVHQQQAESLTSKGATSRMTAQSGHTAKFDIQFTVFDTPTGIWGNLIYNTDIFTRPTMQQFADHFKTLLSDLTAQPNRPIRQIQGLTQADHALVAQANDTATAYPREQTLVDLFEAQVASRGSAEALVWSEGSLTYTALAERVHRLAHHLQACGVRPGDIVGLCMKRSPELIIGILAILEAGGAYVALDPTYPAERIDTMIDTTTMCLILTKTEEAAGLSHVNVETLALDAGWFEGMRGALIKPTIPIYPMQPAAVIFTSGSTGTPKGILLPHRGLVRMNTCQNYMNFGPHQTILCISSPSFDAISMEIWGTLLNGSRLIILSKETLLDTPRLSAAIQHYRATVAVITTALFNQIVREKPDAFAGMDTVLTAGEAADPRAFATLLENPHAPRRVVNAYGPAECVTIASYHQPHQVSADAPAVPIGKPVHNMRLHLTDPHLRRKAPFMPGEILIAGEAMALGYLGRPAQTAKRFLPNPFAQTPGERVYRTGDLARMNAAGDLIFIGRTDNQVKIRGYRIEPGEIEAVLKSLPGVVDATVLVHDDGEKTLVAYVASTTLQDTTVRDALSGRLPHFMVPAVVMILDRLPVNANGKIDRRALPAPDVTRADAALHAPQTEMETVLAAIWCDLLELDAVGRNDNFFSIGGHSLHATRLVTRIRDQIGAHIAIRHIFEAGSLRALAQMVQAAHAGEADLPPIEPIHSREKMPLSFAQQRLWVQNQLQGGSSSYNIPSALRLCGDLNREALTRALHNIVNRHEILRTLLTEQDDQAVQMVVSADRFEVAFTDLSHLPADAQDNTVQETIDTEAGHVFDLQQDIPFRAVLLKQSADRHVLIVTMHHIASDGWSMGILTRELNYFYRAFCHQNPTPLQPLPVQYADFAWWQRNHLAEVLDRQQNYWTQKLAGLKPLDLPLDFPRPEIRPQAPAGSAPFVLEGETAEKLKALIANEEVSLFMALTAAFQVTLAFHQRQTDIAIGIDVANRNRGETEDLIGFFVNQLVIRTHLDDNPSFRDLLQQVQNTTLEAYANQDLPFQTLVSALDTERDRSRTPLFDVKLVMQNTPMEPLALDGMTTQWLNRGHKSANFDLILLAGETDSGLHGALEYSTALFRPATAEILLGNLRRVLDAVTAQPDLTRDAIWRTLDEAAGARDDKARKQFKKAKKNLFHKFKKKTGA